VLFRSGNRRHQNLFLSPGGPAVNAPAAGPGAGDWIICLSDESPRLRDRYPDARLFSTLASLRGWSLQGRLFVTSDALRVVDTQRLLNAIAPCAATSADPAIRALP
jgi:hypothetical protein